MAERIIIHPLNRGVRPIRIELQAEGGRVVGAKAGTTSFWDLSGPLKGKDPWDAGQLTQRYSGLDFAAHALAAVRALEEVSGIAVPADPTRCRNILLALDTINGHLAHFYQYVLPDYVRFPDQGPFLGQAGDFRLPQPAAENALRSAWQAFEIRQKINRMMALMAGKAPHICGIVVGGVTKSPDAGDILRLNSLLGEVAGFVNRQYSEDLAQIERAYPQYAAIGGGVGNLLAAGEYPSQGTRDMRIPAQVKIESAIREIDKKVIRMDCTGSFYEADSSGTDGLGQEVKPYPAKSGGYSWTKGAVYEGKPYETGALARMYLSGSQAVMTAGPRAFSVLGRYRARLEESRQLVELLQGWVSEMRPGALPAVPVELPEQAEAIGTAESAQGSVIHYVRIEDGKIAVYNVLDHFSWNLCPGTGAGLMGPMEQALLGCGAGPANLGPPIDVLRVARSF